MKIELCAASVKAIEFAKNNSFDRIELCQNLEAGGLTPSFGMIQMAIDYGLETHVLIRPRIGGFVYSESEKSLILKEIESISQLKVTGLVVGFYDENKELSDAFLKRITEVANEKELTFHRAFDDLTNWENAVEQLYRHGFKRILTSGLVASLEIGIRVLPKIIEVCKGKLEVMAGGGVNGENLYKLLGEIKPDAVHFSGTDLFIESCESLFNVPRLELNEEKVSSWLNLINSLQTNQAHT